MINSLAADQWRCLRAKVHMSTQVTTCLQMLVSALTLSQLAQHTVKKARVVANVVFLNGSLVCSNVME